MNVKWKHLFEMNILKYQENGIGCLYSVLDKVDRKCITQLDLNYPENMIEIQKVLSKRLPL